MSTLSVHPGSNCSTIVRSILIKYCLTLLLSGASWGVISARFIKTEKYWLTVSSNVWRLFSFGREISQNFSVSMNLAEVSLGEDSDWKKSCTKLFFKKNKNPLILSCHEYLFYDHSRQAIHIAVIVFNYDNCLSRDLYIL